MIDRLRYEFFCRLWHVWHVRLQFFRPFMFKHKYFYDPELYTPEETAACIAQFGDKVEYRVWCAHTANPRPWWHLCCNGNAGGWRTDLCDWLEGKWRNTDYYNRPQEDDHENHAD